MLHFNKSLDLEAEMYQLSHLLTDQKSNLSSQLEMSLFGRSGEFLDMPYVSNDKHFSKSLLFLRNINIINGHQ